MPVLRLTSKLLAEIDYEPSSDRAAAPSPFGDWYGHVFTVERRECIIFINEPTLFVCPALGVSKSDYHQIILFFVGVLAQALRTVGFNEREINWIFAKHKGMAIGRATNRSTLGSLNNRIADAKAHFAWEGGLDICDIGDVTKWLNETPMKPIGYSNGFEQMRSVVEKEMN